METTKVGAVKKNKYVLKCKKDREFQWELSRLLIYYCSSGGKDCLLVDEKLFLTAVVRALSDVVNISGIMVEITPHGVSRQRWASDIEEATANSMNILMDDNELPHTLYNALRALNKILDLEWYNDQTGGREHRSSLMTIFKNARDFSGYYGKTSWRISPKIISEAEKSLIPNLLVSNFGALNFIKILAEKTKKHLEKTLKQLEVEAKSYIDRE